MYISSTHVNIWDGATVFYIDKITLMKPFASVANTKRLILNVATDLRTGSAFYLRKKKNK